MRTIVSTILGFTLYASAASADCGFFLRPGHARAASAEEQILAQPVTKIRFPYVMTPELSAQLLVLDLRLPSFPEARLSISYFPIERSLIPAYAPVESWHAMVRYFNGFEYVLNFPDKEQRKQFLAQFSRVHEHEGEFMDEASGQARFAVFLSPAQLLELQEQMEVKDPNPFEKYSTSSWGELRDLGIDHRERTGATTYFFDAHSRILGVLRGSRYFKAVDHDQLKSIPYASHIAILARQRRASTIANPFMAPDPNDATFGLSEGLATVDAELASIDQFLQNENKALYDSLKAGESYLLTELKDSAAVTKAFTQQTSSPYFTLAKYIRERMQALQLFAAAHPDNYLLADISFDNKAMSLLPSADVLKLRPELRKDLSANHKFVWIKGLGLERGGLLISKRGNLLHQQLLNLMFGKGLGLLFTQLEVVRGGAFRIKYDVNGKAEDTQVMTGDARLLNEFGMLQRVGLSRSQSLNLEMLLRSVFTK